MVINPEVPNISWEEDFGPEDDRRVTDLIVATIADKLPSPAVGQERLFFLVPTPTPRGLNGENYLAAMRGPETSTTGFRVVSLPNKAKCYAVSGEERFRALLPPAFRLGPPELTFIAANCLFDLAAPEDEIADFVNKALETPPLTKMDDAVGLHFDEGDLFEVF